MDPEKLQSLYYIVRYGTNERVMCCDEVQPLIIDNKVKAEQYAKEHHDENSYTGGDTLIKYVAICLLDFIDKFGYQ